MRANLFAPIIRIEIRLFVEEPLRIQLDVLLSDQHPEKVIDGLVLLLDHPVLVPDDYLLLFDKALEVQHQLGEALLVGHVYFEFRLPGHYDHIKHFLGL